MSVTLALVLFFIFLAVFLLVQALVVPVFGEGRQMRRLLKERLASIEEDAEHRAAISLLRQNYLDGLSPFQRFLEDLPGMARLRQLIEQAGMDTPAWQLLLTSVLLALTGGMLSLLFVPHVVVAAVAAVVAGALPFIHVNITRDKRLEQFERELPEAIDLIKRALRAGQPLTAAIKLVGEDLDGPVGKEFQKTSADMAYGNDPRRALLSLMTRVPSVALTGFVTAVLLQRETGGNLVEILEQISSVIRGRYRFQRRVKTLSAEGRISAWVLTMVPIALAGVLSITSPDYLPILFKSPRGQQVLLFSSIMLCIGILWMRRIIRIKV